MVTGHSATADANLTGPFFYHGGNICSMKPGTGRGTELAPCGVRASSSSLS
ncbi:unnamed protein product [Plutella xylostella]|uniref:(diamondback moth) hypothetical protein n=1 Tax=Plutella xylostella TaxID=51655 RepID=A0A8S4G6J4_PLUXY|nr:unnamed protein product [Plutella xylostella]